MSSAVASVFNEESFLNKLDRVTPTQDSIQSLSLWIIHHKMSHDTICRLWLRKLNECKYAASVLEMKFHSMVYCYLFV